MSHYDATLFQVRQFDPATDVARLVRLLNSTEAGEQLDDQVSAEQLQAGLTVAGHDPSRDRWVVPDPADPDRLIAYSSLWKRTLDPGGELAINVLPQWRRRGLGSELLRRSVALGRQLGANGISAYAYAGVPAGAAFLQAHGFTQVSAYVLMRAGSDASNEAPQWPDGFSVRGFDQNPDWDLLAHAMTDSYAGQWGHHHVEAADVRKWWDKPASDLAGILLLFDPSGAVAGVCRTELAPGEGAPNGYIDAPGIVAAHRNVPMRRNFTLAALAYLRGLGATHFDLESWGDGEETLAMYEELGFALKIRADSFTLRL